MEGVTSKRAAHAGLQKLNEVPSWDLAAGAVLGSTDIPQTGSVAIVADFGFIPSETPTEADGIPSGTASGAVKRWGSSSNRSEQPTEQTQ